MLESCLCQKRSLARQSRYVDCLRSSVEVIIPGVDSARHGRGGVDP